MHAENSIALASFVGHNPEATPDTQVEKQTEPADVMLDDGFLFESGFRPISHEITEKEQTRDESPSVTRLKCQHHDCRTSKRTFSRKYELARHMRKHAPPVSYPCPVLGCAYTGQNALYRPDKLKVHLRMSHTDDALCQCPVQTCTVRILPLDLMSGHARLHLRREHQSIEVLGGYKKNLGAVVARCPIGSSKACKKWTEPAGLSSHILGHSEDDRTKFRTEFEEAGLDSVSGHIVCPICFDPILDDEEFATHIHTRHLLEPDSEGAEHFNACYGALLSQARNKADVSWRNIWDVPQYNSFTECQNCPGCGLSLVENRGWGPHPHQENINKHLRMHKGDITEVIQHRRQVLKYYPEIVGHPIFDDLRVISTTTTTTASH